MKYYSLLIVILFGILYTSCRPDDNFIEGGVEMRVSLDTLRFDTVFTRVGSVTRSFKIYNDFDDPVILDEVRIPNPDSYYRMNVDGAQGNNIKDVLVPANDSIYVFVETTIDPDQPVSISPFVIEDLLEIRKGEAAVNVLLQSFGQNANYFPQFQGQGRDAIIDCSGSIVWDDPKPYVIYGRVIFEGCDWILPAGTDVYVHGGLRRQEEDGLYYTDGLIIIGPNASIQARGTAEAPVTFQSDRLEAAFQDVAGQWSGIFIFSASEGSVLEHTQIRHPNFGVRVDSAASITLNSSIIEYTAAQGLVGVHANITANNCLIHNNGSFGVQFTYGGNYEMNYCTVASFGNQGEALFMGNNICVDPLCQEPRRTNGLVANFTNCIFAGSDRDEMLFDDFSRFGVGDVNFDFNFNNTVVQIDDLLDADMFPNFFDRCQNCVRFTRNEDVLFADINDDNFRLDTLSIAETKALPLPLFPEDLEGNNRDQMMPDIGCYEYQY